MAILADGIFKCIFLNELFEFWSKKFVAKDLIDNNQALV